MKTFITALIFLFSLTSVYANSMEYDTDRLGSDYKHIPNINAQSCERACNTETPCKSWTYVKPNTIQGADSHCYLKNAIPNKTFCAACISGLAQRSVTTFDDVKLLIAQRGRGVSFVKKTILGNYSEELLRSMPLQIKRHTRTKGTSLAQRACYDIGNNYPGCNLKKIVNAVNSNGKTKLYISIEKKVGGLAKKRVDSMKSTLAWMGLNPSKYHVQRVSKKDKKDRAWLSKNSQLRMRIVETR